MVSQNTSENIDKEQEASVILSHARRIEFKFRLIYRIVWDICGYP